MAVPIQIKLDWKDRATVMRRLEMIAPGISVAMGKTAFRHAKKIATVAAQRAPVRTGRYRRSIHAAFLKDKPEDTRKGAGPFGRTQDPYAAGVYALFTWRWLEFGTVKMRAQPHLLPTYRAQRPTFRRAMKIALRKAVKDAMAGRAASIGDLRKEAA